ncbi:MAG: FtsX-like permease family protein, partial [Bacteroidota bacterium]
FFQHVHPRFPTWFQSWQGDPAATFVKLDDPTNAIQFQEQVQDILAKYLKEDEVNPHRLINLRDLHFSLAQVDGQINHYVRGDQGQLNLLISVASLILFMACFNFINLLTARSINRSKEVGIRKSIGATKGQVFTQFITESSMQVALSMILSIGWLFLILPYFQRLTGVELGLGSELIVSFLPYLVLLFLLLTFLSGLYPAVVVSRFTPRKALSSAKPGSEGSSSLRGILLTVQYGIVIIMVAGLLIVERQFQFITNKPLGFDADQLLIVEVNGAGVRNNFELLKQDLLSHPDVSAVSGLTRMIAGYRSGVDVAISDPADVQRQQSAQFYGMDSDGIAALNLKLASGHMPKGNKRLDSTSVYLNETATGWFGDEEVVGQWIEMSDHEGEDALKAKVAGIIEDFHYSSLHEPIGPVVIGYLSNPFQSLDDIVIRINSQDLSKTLAYVEEVHNRFDENDVMTWEFMDDMVARAYQRELIIRDVFAGATTAAFIIAVIGLISLLSLSTIERTKELCIRKILGAEYFSLMGLQAQNFIKYAGYASFIAIPIVWVISNNWLDSFAYRSGFSPLPFLASIITVLLSTILIVWIINHEVIKSNPVQSLRNE